MKEALNKRFCDMTIEQVLFVGQAFFTVETKFYVTGGTKR
jgi:hypothetical protein